MGAKTKTYTNKQKDILQIECNANFGSFKVNFTSRSSVDWSKNLLTAGTDREKSTLGSRLKSTKVFSIL